MEIKWRIGDSVYFWENNCCDGCPHKGEITEIKITGKSPEDITIVLDDEYHVDPSTVFTTFEEFAKALKESLDGNR